MTIEGRFTFLGTGAAMGVPMLACPCEVCASSSPYDQRKRCSAMLEIGEKRFVIDVGPDFRQQALDHAIDDLDGILFTHSHSDHVSGIDDLRAYYLLYRAFVPCMASRVTHAALKQRFPYLFGANEKSSNLTAQLDFSILEEEHGTVDFMGLRFQYFSYSQGKMPVTGYRFGNCAYLTDIKDYPETIFEDLEGVENLILSTAWGGGAKVHFSLEESKAFSERVGAKKTYLTHLSHLVSYEKMQKEMPEGISLAYDGLEISFHFPQEDLLYVKE